MSNSWKQYGGTNHLDNTRLGSIVANDLILKNGYNGDLIINGNLKAGNISVDNDVLINGNLTANKSVNFNGNIFLNGNTLVNGTIVFSGSINTNSDINVKGNIFIGQNATIDGNIYLSPHFIIIDNSGIGINTTPISTLDISGNNIQSLNVFSNNNSTFNVITQNKAKQGILLTANTISTSIQFFNDTSLNYTSPFSNNNNAQIKYTTGGNLEIDTTNNLTIASQLTVVPNSIYVSKPNLIKHTPLAETTTIYDISSTNFLRPIYGNTAVNTGNALTLLASDTSSNTFLHIKSQSPYKGISIGGGPYPNDQTRSMGTLGYTDPSSNTYYAGQMIISGNNIVHNTVTTGINTYMPTTERYALDINGETRIHTGDLRYTTPPFCVYSIASFGENIIAIGSYIIGVPNIDKFRAYTSRDGGNTWNLYSLNGISDLYPTSNRFNYVFYYNSTTAFIVGQNGYKGYTINNGESWSDFTLVNNGSSLPNNATSFYAYQKNISTTRCFIGYNESNVGSFYFDVSNTAFNGGPISTINVASNNIGSVQNIVAFTANSTTLFLLSDNISNTYYLYSALLASPSTTTTITTYTSFTPKCIIANGTFLAVGGVNGIYISQNAGSSFTFTSIPSVTINTFAFYSSTQFLAFGDSGAIYYTTNTGITWLQLPEHVLNSAGTKGYLLNSTFNNINSATFINANTVFFNGIMTSNVANSNIYSLYAPNLFNANYNNTLDVSGSIYVTGAINVNDGGFINSNNSTFNLLNSPSNLFIGNSLGNGNTTVNNNFIVSGNTIYTNRTNSTALNTGSMIVYGGSSINGNLFLGGNLTTYNNVYINKNLYTSQNIFANGGTLDSTNVSFYLLNSPYNLFIGNILGQGTTTINNDTAFMGNLLVKGNLTLTGTSTISVDTSNSGITTYTNPTDSYKLRSGAVILYGGMSIDGNIFLGGDNNTYGNSYVGNTLYVNDSLSIGSNRTPPNYKLQVTGNANISTTLFVTGNASIGKTTAPGFTLDVSGIVNASGLYVNGTRYVESQWTTTNNNIYYTTGNVGIGTTTPLYRLDINGNLHTTNNVIIDGNVGIRKTNPGFSLDVSGIINANALYVNGLPYIGSQWTTIGANIYYTTGNVGIGKTTPGFTLDVSGIVNASGLYVNGIRYVESQWTTTGANIYYTTGNVGIGTTTPLYSLDITGNLRVNPISSNPIIIGNVGTQLYGIDLGAGDSSGGTSNSGKIMYGPASIDGNSLVIIGKGTTSGNRNIKLFDNTTINGNLTINGIINAYTGNPMYTGVVIQKDNSGPNGKFNLTLTNEFLPEYILGFNSYASDGSNNPITNAGDQQIIYTSDITDNTINGSGLTIAPYDSNVSGIRLDSNGFLGICKKSSTYDLPLDVGKSSGGSMGIQTRTIRGIDPSNNNRNVLHIVTIPNSTADVRLGYNINSTNVYDITSGLSIGWNSSTPKYTLQGTTDFLNWSGSNPGGFSFYNINKNTSTTNYSPKILMYIDVSSNKTIINGYPDYGESTPYISAFDVNGSGRFIQDISSLILKSWTRESARTSGTRLIFDTDAAVINPGNIITYNSFPYTYISAIQDASNSATLNFATNNQIRMTITNNGLVGIGTTSPGFNLDVSGNARFDSKNIYVGDSSGNCGVGINSLASNTGLNKGTNNTAFGYNSLFTNSTGNQNTAVGDRSLYTNISGSLNTAIGYQSLYLNRASFNTALGFAALYNNTDGSYNVAVGNESLFYNNTGGSNTAIGHRSLFNNTASGNTAVGYQSLLSNTTGANNVAVGYRCLSNNTTTNCNTAVGFEVLANMVGPSAAGNTGIGYRALRYNTTGYFNNAFGYQALLNNTTGNQNTAMGNDSLNNNLDGSNNSAFGYQSLGTNTSGNNNTAFGYRSLFNNTASENTAVGADALFTNSVGTLNTAVGFQALYRNTGYYNTAVGHQSLTNNSTGDRNTAFGMHSLLSNTTANHNTAIGSEALALSTTGYYNTALGSIALFNNTTGTNNVAIGYGALFTNTASENTALGFQALFTNSTATYNVAVGFEALLFNTANSNTAMGHQSLRTNTTGKLNTAVGWQSLYSNQHADRNTAIGMHALLSNIDGSYNTAIGSESLALNTYGYLNTAVGSTALFNNDNGVTNVAIGNDALFSNISGGQNTAVGYQALYYNKVFNSTAIGFRSLFNNTTGTNNTALGFQSLLNNTTGNNNTAIGYEALYTNTTGINNTAIGYDALYNNTENYNTAVGTQALYTNTTGYQNTAIGFRSLFSNTTGGICNTAVGFESLNANLGGIYNTAVGWKSLHLNTSGYRNTAMGMYALVSNISGAFNTAIGSEALNTNSTGNYNIALGSTVLYKNSSGSNNTAMGYNALFNNEQSNNTAMGYNALFTNTNGYYNNALGFNALYYNITGTDNCAFGCEALLGTSGQSGSNNTAIGNSALRVNSNGRSTAVGYGALLVNTNGENTAVGYLALSTNTTGTANVAVGKGALSTSTTGTGNTAVGLSAGSADAAFTTGSYCTFLGVNTRANGNHSYSTALGRDATITASNQIMMGTAAETVQIPGTLNTTGVITAASFNATSDYRVKTDVHPITDTIDNLQPKTYYNNLTNKTEYGFIAHEVANIFPNMVTGKKDEIDEKGVPKYQSINYIGIIPILVKEIQELKTQNKLTQQILFYYNIAFLFIIMSLTGIFIAFINR